MQGIEKITERIRADAQSEGDEILENARKEAEALAADYRAKAAALTRELDEKSARDASGREGRLVSAAALEARKALLAAKQEMLDETFDDALKQLATLPDADRQVLLIRIIGEAAPNGGGEVILNAADAKGIGKAVVQGASKVLKNAVTLSDKTHDQSGGLLLCDGDVTVNCTFEAIIRQKREEMASEIAAILFT